MICNKTFGLVAVLLGISTMSAAATPVVVGDYEWRQVTDTAGFSYVEVATVCDTDSGICDGALGGVDFTGWTWADNHEVLDNLLSVLTPLTDPYGSYRGGGQTDWATAFLQMFEPTFTAPGELAAVRGMLRNLHYDGYQEAHDALVYDYEASGRDTVSLFAQSWIHVGIPEHGVWLYRAASVSEPSIVLLLLAGLVPVVALRRRRPACQRNLR